MKVLLVLPTDELGGAEQVLRMITDYHIKDEVHLIFLRTLSTGHWRETRKHVRCLEMKASSSFLGMIRLYFDWLKGRSTEYDRVYASHVLVNGMLGLARRTRLLKTRFLIARESTTIFTRFTGFKLLGYKALYHSGYKAIDLLICQTDDMKEQLLDALPRLSSRTLIRVFPNPIDMKKTLLKGNENFNITSRTGKFIVAAGRLIPEKGFDILIQSFSNIHAKFSDHDLIILGEGHLRNDLEDQINELNLSDRIHLPGRVKNVYPYFRKAELCVISSRVEGFPNVLLQMMSQNSKVVSTLCAGGISEIPGLTLVDTDNPVQLGEAIQNSLLSDSTLNARTAFDSYLSSRDIHCFMKKLDHIQHGELAT